ncbi:ABC transporter substrate-binding protein [Actinoplanes sp. NPDC051411]|uniref:ABC transporter substrate-binding protein n=1 Tax=Actinoplanes sp. NPDC051411 TaxID=3155522 RepID=UPI00342D1193
MLKRIAAAAAASITLAGLAACGNGGSDAKGGGTLKVSFSEVVADELPLWIAQDSGLFAKHNVQVDLTNLSSSDGFPALISGQTQLASIGASEMVSGAASGAKVSYIATLTPVFPYQLYSKVPGDQLRGKKIGITSTSGSLYIATLQALQQLGMTKSDVQLITLGSVTNVNNALVSGSIDAALSHPPGSAKIEASGYKPVLDLAKQKIPTSNVGIAVLQSYAKDHRGEVQNFISALLEAIAREKSDKAYSISELKAHLKVDDEKALDETYQFYAQEVLPAVPTPTVQQLATSQNVLGAANPKVKQLDLSTIVDTSFVSSAGTQG